MYGDVGRDKHRPNKWSLIYYILQVVIIQCLLAVHRSNMVKWPKREVCHFLLLPRCITVLNEKKKLRIIFWNKVWQKDLIKNYPRISRKLLFVTERESFSEVLIKCQSFMALLILFLVAWYVIFWEITDWHTNNYVFVDLVFQHMFFDISLSMVCSSHL